VVQQKSEAGHGQIELGSDASSSKSAKMVEIGRFFVVLLREQICPRTGGWGKDNSAESGKTARRKQS